MVSALIIAILTSGLIVGATFVLKKRLITSSGSASASIQEEITAITRKLEELAQYAPAYTSRKQLENIEQQLTDESTQLEKEKIRLKEVETKLESAQKLVETKEGQQQETKSSREEDEQKLRELMAAYTDISSESIGLERKLAASLKNLETIVSEVKMTDDQKAVLNDLLNSLTEGSSRLRELLTEYQVVNERLEMLQQQHGDLEEEYTKLVEQQLGE